jgi:hypothetical protein
MSIHLTRQRGGTWYARGIVRWGKKKVTVPEFSTGCHSRANAEAAVAAEERRQIDLLTETPGERADRLTINDCLLAYLRRPGGIAEYDKVRVRDFAEQIGD